jgi:hypothetical protein
MDEEPRQQQGQLSLYQALSLLQGGRPDQPGGGGPDQPGGGGPNQPGGGGPNQPGGGGRNQPGSGMPMLQPLAKTSSAEERRAYLLATIELALDISSGVPPLSSAVEQE